jgi:putative oxygen-independent coproporphyrinogen III oxidase
MIPTSLYIHIPWCVKKCPYCDFNSHTSPSSIPELEYINVLIRDLEKDLPRIWGRKITTIFIGGGTPSLFSAGALEKLMLELHARLAFSPDIEITLEANPGTFEQQRFIDYRNIGINRLSLGVQSFQDDKLSLLGRIHAGKEAHLAIDAAKKAGFTNFNIDLMFGLPSQSLSDALSDLTTAMTHQPTHLSWYQLTLEPNTPFFQFPPKLPHDDAIFTMQEQGQQLLAQHHYQQYEISAYSQQSYQCQHNRNYWEFGDYVGIGAGAHSKLTDPATGNIQRYYKIKHPKHYMSATEYVCGEQNIKVEELSLEFMMNALRLCEKIPTRLFEERTGLPIQAIAEQLGKAQELELLDWGTDYLETTARGKLYLNDLLGCFM